MKSIAIRRPPYAAIIFVCLIALILLPSEIVVAQNEEPVDVPLIKLIAQPEKYNGILVRTIGFIGLYDGDIMYPHEEDCKHALMGNGIWIYTSDDHDKFVTKYDKRYCLIEAIFDADARGHKEYWSGGFKNIKRLDVWSSPARPRLTIFRTVCP